MRVARAGIRLAAVVAVGCAAGCGGVDEHANRPRPPAEIAVAAAILDDGVRVSPPRFGAGPVVLLVSNQTDRAQVLTFESDDEQAGITASTARIPAAGTATLEVDPRRGRYAVRTRERAIAPATVRVGPPRPSAQDSLLEP